MTIDMTSKPLRLSPFLGLSRSQKKRPCICIQYIQQHDGREMVGRQHITDDHLNSQPVYTVYSAMCNFLSTALAAIVFLSSRSLSTLLSSSVGKWTGFCCYSARPRQDDDDKRRHSSVSGLYYLLAHRRVVIVPSSIIDTAFLQHVHRRQ